VSACDRPKCDYPKKGAQPRELRPFSQHRGYIMPSVTLSTHLHATSSLLIGILSLCLVSGSSRSDLDPPPAGPRSQVDAKYLDGAVGKASEDEVASTLGFPSEKHDLDNGGKLWTYRYKYQRTHLIFGHRSLCTAIVLAFNAARTLQKWSQERCAEESGNKSQ